MFRENSGDYESNSGNQEKCNSFNLEPMTSEERATSKAKEEEEYNSSLGESFGSRCCFNREIEHSPVQQP